jgi:hypothetical protein
MPWIKTIVHEIVGLFVDDGSFALAILVFVGAAWLLLPRVGIPAEWGGIILFVGLAVILVESATRRARR